jgi:hypothetical protein
LSEELNQVYQQLKAFTNEQLDKTNQSHFLSSQHQAGKEHQERLEEIYNK